MRHSVARALLAMLLSWSVSPPPALRADDHAHQSDPAAKLPTKTPIKHLVVIFDENISFDHYFGTYPNALNLPGDRGSSRLGRSRALRLPGDRLKSPECR
jgi:phospholipase C